MGAGQKSEGGTEVALISAGRSVVPDNFPSGTDEGLGSKAVSGRARTEGAAGPIVGPGKTAAPAPTGASIRGGVVGRFGRGFRRASGEIPA